MKAMVIEKTGEPSVFKLAILSKPQVTSGHVLIQVKASSVNPLDCKLRSGQYPLLPDPAILNGDVAGIVAEVGPNVSEFKVGDKVYGCAGGVTGLPGALAEYMLADANLIAHMPASLSFTEAGVLPLVTETAWEAIIRLANVQKNQTVLVHGGVGGVSHIAIQLAKYRGAKVFTTCSTPEKIAAAKKLGADVVIDYTTHTVSDYVTQYTQGRGFDVVFDTVGGDNIDNSIEAAATYGQIITTLGTGLHDLLPLYRKGASLHTVFQPTPLLTGQNRRHYNELLTQAARLVDQKQLHPLLHTKVFGFSEIAKAHELAESGQFMGKIALQQDLTS